MPHIVANYLRQWLPLLFCCWVVVSIGFSIWLAGFTTENITRLLVIVFLLIQLLLRNVLIKSFSSLSPKIRFVALGTLLAAVVEGFHMISVPVFLSLRITSSTTLSQGIINYALDLLYTVPAYLVILSVLWFFINKYYYSFWQYVLVMGVGQTLGDGGGLFFIGAPWMLIFLPYPMTNYHALNIIPFLAVRDQLPPDRMKSMKSYLATPAIIGTYLVCGAVIQLFGRYFGLVTQ